MRNTDYTAQHTYTNTEKQKENKINKNSTIFNVTLMINYSDVDCFGTLSAAETMDNTHVALYMLLRWKEKRASCRYCYCKPSLKEHPDTGTT